MKKKGIIVAVVLLIIFGISKIDKKSPGDYYSNDNRFDSALSSDSSGDATSLNGSLQNAKDEGNGENGKDGEFGSSNDTDNKNKNSKDAKANSNKSSKPGKGNGKDTIKVTIYIDVKNLQKKKNYAMLKPELRKYVPKNGLILPKQTIEVKKGATSFEVLQKAVRLNRIQMEYQGADQNIYNSVYIQGINHLYEFSAGGESGWMYSVNGVFPNYGMSRKVMQNNDTLRMVYTCDLGCDVGYSMKTCS